MTTDKPEQLTLVGAEDLARHHEGRILLTLHAIATWAATPDDRSIDWELERTLLQLRHDAAALRALRNESDIPF